ncbi:MAG: hypothetical protein J5I93_07425 [Pirellulaceae bacterium]|nr:hypothetical protein [Pirellulaceae bacterium]
MFDPRDEHHSYAVERLHWLEHATIVVPWPVVYETVRTRLARRPDRLAQLNRQLKRPGVVYVDDHEFRAEAYSLAVDYAIYRRWPISMVDMLCRLMIEDENIRIDAVLTPNQGDFRDVCASTATVLL